MKPVNKYAWVMRAIVILVVPGALWVWVAWCLLRAMHTHRNHASSHAR